MSIYEVHYFELVCDRCDASIGEPLQQYMEDELMAIAIKEGWKIGYRHLCPACSTIEEQ